MGVTAGMQNRPAGGINGRRINADIDSEWPGLAPGLPGHEPVRPPHPPVGPGPWDGAHTDPWASGTHIKLIKTSKTYKTEYKHSKTYKAYSKTYKSI